MLDFQLRLDDTERPSCGKEVEISNSATFMETGRNSGLRLNELTTFMVRLNLTRLSLPQLTNLARSSARSETEIFL